MFLLSTMCLLDTVSMFALNGSISGRVVLVLTNKNGSNIVNYNVI